MGKQHGESFYRLAELRRRCCFVSQASQVAVDQWVIDDLRVGHVQGSVLSEERFQVDSKNRGSTHAMATAAGNQPCCVEKLPSTE